MAIIGFILIGLVIGLLARIIAPGPHPRGIIVTMVIGIVGAVIATYGGQALGLYRLASLRASSVRCWAPSCCWCCCGCSVSRAAPPPLGASLLFLMLLSPCVRLR